MCLPSSVNFFNCARSDAAHLLDRDMRPLGRLQLDPGNITATALDTHGIGLVTGSVEGIVQLWDLKLRQQKGNWTDPTGSGFGVRAVVNCTSQPHLVYVSNRSGNIWTLVRRSFFVLCGSCRGACECSFLASTKPNACTYSERSGKVLVSSYFINNVCSESCHPAHMFSPMG